MVPSERAPPGIESESQPKATANVFQIIGESFLSRTAFEFECRTESEMCIYMYVCMHVVEIVRFIRLSERRKIIGAGWPTQNQLMFGKASACECVFAKSVG